MSLTQTRPKDLDPYVQKAVGEEGYINPAELLFVVDHPLLSRPQAYSNNNFVAYAPHVEKGRITNLISHTVAQSFVLPFSDVPNDDIKVYRISNGLRLEVLRFNITVTPVGFSFEIDSEESLSGIIVQYTMQ